MRFAKLTAFDVVKWAVAGLLVLFVVFTALAIGGTKLPTFPTDISHQKPYADFVGREYRVTSEVAAYAWNDFPDKATILNFTLMPPPGMGNRFVSYRTPLRLGQTVRLVSAWRHFSPFGSTRYYEVILPDAGLPDGIPIMMRVESDGVPDPAIYQPVDR